ncbi:hypothetical protein [Anditalea andensis]|uniref:Uncharacterized protein n=1 Tax=Anditalea andensis TaxID=1048983 RepID=A0A074KW51_9BACT|nr:hypothetical protein [Anditalea andensis]KEO71848.1 hypothetical protein EL17_21060 [Anditalea andensis]
MKKLIYTLLILTVLTCTIGCQSHRKLTKQASQIDSLEEALNLKKKYPTSEIEIHKLDSISFFNNSIYSRLQPGVLMRIGQENSQAANLYKLLKVDQTPNKSETFQYYVLQVHLK